MLKQRELDPYKIGIFHWVPAWFKIPFLKWWSAGIVYYFVGVGSAFLQQGSYEMMFSLGAVIGLMNSYVVSRIIRDMTHREDRDNPNLSIRKRGPLGTLMNILLSLVIVIVIGFSYEGINRLIIILFSPESTKIYFPADPIGFALFYIGYDFLWRRLTFRRKSAKDINTNKNYSDNENR